PVLAGPGNISFDNPTPALTPNNYLFHRILACSQKLIDEIDNSLYSSPTPHFKTLILSHQEVKWTNPLKWP
ncbi:MAG: hypothetical protein O3B73_18285, partial [bacterium]|nr:hypothetical protein [bacterium]